MLRCAEPVERKFLSDPSMDYHPVAVDPSRANVHRAPGARLRGHTRPGHTALAQGARRCAPARTDRLGLRAHRDRGRSGLLLRSMPRARGQRAGHRRPERSGPPCTGHHHGSWCGKRFRPEQVKEETRLGGDPGGARWRGPRDQIGGHPPARSRRPDRRPKAVARDRSALGGAGGLSAVLIAATALLLDWLLGEPRRRHPVIGFGRWLSAASAGCTAARAWLQGRSVRGGMRHPVVSRTIYHWPPRLWPASHPGTRAQKKGTKCIMRELDMEVGHCSASRQGNRLWKPLLWPPMAASFSLGPVADQFEGMQSYGTLHLPCQLTRLPASIASRSHKLPRWPGKSLFRRFGHSTSRIPGAALAL